MLTRAVWGETLVKGLRIQSLCTCKWALLAGEHAACPVDRPKGVGLAFANEMKHASCQSDVTLSQGPLALGSLLVEPEHRCMDVSHVCTLHRVASCFVTSGSPPEQPGISVRCAVTCRAAAYSRARAGRRARLLLRHSGLSKAVAGPQRAWGSPRRPFRPASLSLQATNRLASRTRDAEQLSR